MCRNNKKRQFERYDILKSPFSQKPTQAELAALLNESRDDLRRLINYKEEFIKRENKITKGGKVRPLAYPTNRLRRVHERMKFHLNKISQPSYLFSPRKGRSQRDNAELHLNQEQYLVLDLKQFYPSTSFEMVHRWLELELGMYTDVAGMISHLVTVDGVVAYGSPLTPVLCSLIHRPMFDDIAQICDARGLRFSVWVDDLTISGRFSPGIILVQIREIIRRYGLRSHKIKFISGNNTIFITGIGVVGSNLIATNSLNLRLKKSWEDFHSAQTSEERESCIQRLLSELGTQKYIVGPKTKKGQEISGIMNSLRQKKKKFEKNNLNSKMNPSEIVEIEKKIDEGAPF
jgi:RNA-directed DNA polymerase